MAVPKGWQDWVDTVLTWISKICTIISGGCLVVLVATFGWLVFGRYVLNDTPTWVEQLSLILIVFITFLSSSVGVKERTHLYVELLPYALSPAKRRYLFAVTHLCVAGFGIVMAVNAYELTQFNWGIKIPLLGWPEGLRTLPLIASGVLLVAFSLGNIIEDFSKDPASQDRVPDEELPGTTAEDLGLVEKETN